MPYTLDAEGQRLWQQGYRQLQEAEDLCQRAAACGFDTAEREMICSALREKYERIRQQFIPGKARE